MRCQPDGDDCWIAHMEDHNGEYHVLWPQKRKEDDEICRNMKERWLIIQFNLNTSKTSSTKIMNKKIKINKLKIKLMIYKFLILTINILGNIFKYFDFYQNL